MSLQEQFKAEVRAFLARSNMTPTAFGRDGMGDSMFVFELEQGRSPSLRVVEKARAFMKRHKRKKVA